MWECALQHIIRLAGKYRLYAHLRMLQSFGLESVSNDLTICRAAAYVRIT